MTGYDGQKGGAPQGGTWGGGGYEDQFNRAYGDGQQSGGYGQGAGAQQQPPYGTQGYGSPAPAYGAPSTGAPAYGAPGPYGADPSRGATGYGGSPYGPGVMPPRQRKGTKGPKILTFIGVAFLVIAVVAGVLSVRALSNFVEDAEIHAIGPAGGQITAEAGQDWALYATGAGSPQMQTDSCTVTGPDGADVPLRSPNGELEVNGYQLGHQFTTTQAGDYVIRCEDSAFVGHDLGFGGLMASVGGIVIAVFGGILGFVLTLAGGIWWGVRASSDRRV